ncbi:hypothetical protein [Kitasatospora sp. NPDC094015]|uniref:hypothetical protein n=1 Tax=Kitasatospora sp. NPDC094015 TaxID=3155205 RepID=UPI00331BE4BC
MRLPLADIALLPKTNRRSILPQRSDNSVPPDSIVRSPEDRPADPGGWGTEVMYGVRQHPVRAADSIGGTSRVKDFTRPGTRQQRVHQRNSSSRAHCAGLSRSFRMSEPQLNAVPLDFLCEHTPSKSRVLVRVSHDRGPDSLQAVLTCRHAELADRATRLLLQALKSTPDTWAADRVDELCRQLPDAPASSLRQAVTRAFARAWPTDPGSLANWTEKQKDQAATESNDNEGDGRAESVACKPVPRLRDLPGQVVRVAVLREFHIHDRSSLLEAARAQGWSPGPAEELYDNDPYDVVGAVMWLTDEDIEIAGADTLTGRGQGSVLRRDKGHEVARWSRNPVVADFGPGSHLLLTEQSEEPVQDEVPDFASLFPVEPVHCDDPECEDDSCLWNLTPRTADILHGALCELADEAYEDAEELGDGRLVPDAHEGTWGVFTRMPKLTVATDLQWRRKFARAVDDLTDDLEHGRWPQPTCTAEELALHLALDDAQNQVAEIGTAEASNHAELPVHRDDYDFRSCTDMFFQDTDVLMLYSSRFDGIEGPDTDANQQLAVGDLRPAAWFEPFDNVEARDPRRGFRR